MMKELIVEGLAGFYLLFWAMLMTTQNFRSFVVFRAIPAVLGVWLIMFSFAHYFDWPLR